LRSAFSFFIFLSAAALFLPHDAPAENPKEQYQKLQKEMEAQKERIEEAKRREHSVLEDLDGVSRRLNDIEKELRGQRGRLRQTEAEIRKTEAAAASSRAELERKKDWMKRRLRAMQRYGNSYELFAVFTSSEDLSQIMRRWKYLEKAALSERRVIDGYVATLKGLEEKEEQLLKLRAALKRDEEKIRVTETTLSETKRDRERLLVSVRTEKSRHEKMFREMQEASRRLRDIIRKLDETETYEAKGFPALKGKLSWPVGGRVAIPYGSQKDPRFNTPVFRSGIYIRADEDPVRAVHAGKVVFADWFKGYGNLLIINHGEGYHTLYANLSEIFFKVGDIIKVHDTVGKVGESGILNAPSLYFEIRYKGKPLDPVQWLKKR
jgi:septal ring factor EnvC (AmiA/AmiB activator)